MLPTVLASIKADDKKAPTQGVQDNEKIIPNKTEKINKKVIDIKIPITLFINYLIQLYYYL